MLGALAAKLGVWDKVGVRLMSSWPAAIAMILCFGVLPAHAQDTITLSRRDDPLSPYAAQIAQEAFRRIGHKTDFLLLPSERALQSADAGKTSGDVARMAGIEKIYPNLIRVPEPMLDYDTVAFTTGLAFKVDGWESLRPYRLCILRGMKLAEIGTEGMDSTISNDVPQSIMMLKGGRCDVAVLGYTAWPEIDRMNAGPLRSLDPPVSSVPLFLVVHKKLENLVPGLAQALRQMHGDGTIQAILADLERKIQAARQSSGIPAK